MILNININNNNASFLILSFCNLIKEMSRKVISLPNLSKRSLKSNTEISPLKLATCEILASNSPILTFQKRPSRSSKSHSVNISHIFRNPSPIQHKNPIDTYNIMKGYSASLTPIKIRIESRRRLRPATPYIIFEDQAMPAELAHMNHLRRSVIRELKKDTGRSLNTASLEDFRRNYEFVNSSHLTELSNL